MMIIEEKDEIYNCVLIPNGYWQGFDSIAKVIEQKLSFKFKQKLDDFDSYYWMLDFKGTEINLHYHEMIGDVELFVNKENPLNKNTLTDFLDLLKKHI